MNVGLGLGGSGCGRRFGFGVVAVATVVCILELSCGAAADILGCGGFVRSPYKLDFDKIEIKLFTKQGSLKLKTECAPTGYYFIPLENKGEYVLKISPPEGWTFDPPDYSIKFDAETDKCSKGEDINFDFKGFSVLGKVISEGYKEGPKDVKLLLSGPDKLQLTGVTGEGGSFNFNSIPPGSYSLKASHGSLKFSKDKDSYAFQITNKNIIVDNQIVVVGYDLSGSVMSDGAPVEKVTLVLLTSDQSMKPPSGCDVGKNDINLPAGIQGKILCSQNSDKTGVFRFGGLTPGKYTVVPVYKGANTVYNVSPDRLEVKLGHGSMELPSAFEVEGFTVQGRVKGFSGASVMVNGELRATSGHDGTFTIAKMKPGTYEFQVTAEKFLFEKKRVTIQPTNPVIPDFVPSKVQTCGSITTSSKSRMPQPQITLVLQKSGSGSGQSELIREKISDPTQACIYLAEGSYTAWIESTPEKYFLPEKHQILSGSSFSFKEFSGSISGSAICKLSTATCNGAKIRAETPDGILIQEKSLSADGKFIFENLESGDYKLRVEAEGGTSTSCWKTESFDKIQLKNSDVKGITFEQIGVPLEIISSHKTKVKITGKSASATQILQLEPDTVKKICLTDPNSPPDSYKIIPDPEGCHVFDKAEYSLKLGQRLELIGKKHRHSWNIVASEKIPDLKVTRNGESYTQEELKVKGKGKNKNNEKIEIVEKVDVDGKTKTINYEISSYEQPGNSAEWQIFSYGFIFEPRTFNIDALSDCQDNLLQVVAKQSHVIKGVLTPPLEGVEIRIDLIGDPDSTIFVTSNSQGEYIAGPFVHPSGFKVTPELAGYTFKPLEKNPYSFTVSQLAKIHVKVVLESGSESGSVSVPVPVSSVLLSLSESSNAYRLNKITDDKGEMTFGELQPGQYYLKALLKEFQFQPSAMNIDLKEQESKIITLKAIRESFSLYGQLSSLSGELMPNLLVSAKGVGNCSEYGEENTSDEMGNFRIWALKSYCNYKISVVKKDEFASRVERTIPDVLDVKIGAGDIHNISFVVITPVRRMDVSLRCYTNNEKSLEHLKAVVSSSKTPDTPLHVTPFNGISYIILPPIPKDDAEYIITFESTLNKYQYTYRLPSEIQFSAKSAYSHFKFDFNIEPAPVDQEIGKNSYIAFAMIVFVVLMIANYEKVGNWAKDFIENYTSGANGIAAKKSKSKTK